MDQVPSSIIVVIALLTLFLCFAVGIKYEVHSNFTRTRLVMSAFFFFIVLTLTSSFWEYRYVSLPYTLPAAAIGIIIGYAVAVRTEQKKLAKHGVRHYIRHFAQLHFSDFTQLHWWSLVNFYTVMSGILLINLIGLSTVFFGTDAQSAIRTSMVGAFLLGTIFPYLIHLWSIKAPHHASSTTKDK